MLNSYYFLAGFVLGGMAVFLLARLFKKRKGAGPVSVAAGVASSAGDETFLLGLAEKMDRCMGELSEKVDVLKQDRQKGTGLETLCERFQTLKNDMESLLGPLREDRALLMGFFKEQSKTLLEEYGKEISKLKEDFNNSFSPILEDRAYLVDAFNKRFAEFSDTLKGLEENFKMVSDTSKIEEDLEKIFTGFSDIDRQLSLISEKLKGS